jgi:hypothetical protein
MRMTMDNNVLAGGLLGAFMLKHLYDENVKRDELNNQRIVNAVLSIKPIEDVVTPAEEIYEAPKSVWPFV